MSSGQRGPFFFFYIFKLIFSVTCCCACGVIIKSNHRCELTSCSVYVNTCPLARGDRILLADQLISNLLAQIGDLILVAKSITLKLILQSMNNE